MPDPQTPDERAAIRARAEAEKRWPAPPRVLLDDERVYPSSAVREYMRGAFEAGAEWQREHLPTLPDRETVFAAALGASSVTITDSPYQKAEWLRITDAILSLFPGRSEAEVKAEELREAAGLFRDTLHDHGAAGVLDRLAVEGGVS